jgi:hypothetical protein
MWPALHRPFDHLAKEKLCFDDDGILTSLSLHKIFKMYNFEHKWNIGNPRFAVTRCILLTPINTTFSFYQLPLCMECAHSGPIKTQRDCVGKNPMIKLMYWQYRTEIALFQRLLNFFIMLILKS